MNKNPVICGCYTIEEKPEWKLTLRIPGSTLDLGQLILGKAFQGFLQ